MSIKETIDDIGVMLTENPIRWEKIMASVKMAKIAIELEKKRIEIIEQMYFNEQQ